MRSGKSKTLQQTAAVIFKDAKPVSPLLEEGLYGMVRSHCGCETTFQGCFPPLEGCSSSGRNDLYYSVGLE